jgi:hypothetical protein
LSKHEEELTLSKYEGYETFAIHCRTIPEAMKKISSTVENAVRDGWTELYLLPDEDMLSVRGVRPPDKAAIQAAKEKRRKQFERLKKEFEGGEQDRITKLIDKMTLK